LLGIWGLRFPRLVFDCLVDLELAVGVGASAESAIGRLQLVMHVGKLRRQAGCDLEVYSGFLCLPVGEKLLSEFIVGLGVVGILGHDFFEPRHRFFHARLLEQDEGEIVLRLFAVGVEFQFGAEVGFGLLRMAVPKEGETCDVMGPRSFRIEFQSATAWG
jgi:hypothetical protein